MATKPNGRWVVYERREDKFVFLSKLFKTKGKAEKERLRLKGLPEHKRSPIGVGFVRTPK